MQTVGAVGLAVVISLSGCSFWRIGLPSKNEPANEKPDCTTSYAPLIADAAFGIVPIPSAIVLADDNGTAALGLAALSVIFLTSYVTGSIGHYRCTDWKRYHDQYLADQRRREIEAPPPAVELPTGWVAVAPPRQGFSVYMPQHPKEGMKALKEGTLRQYITGAYYVHVVHANKDYHVVDAALDMQQARFFEVFGGTRTISERRISLQGRSGREVVFETADAQYHVRIYTTKRRITSVAVRVGAPHWQQFLDSFRFL